MKITRASHILTMDGNSPALFLKLETDAGMTGWGEGTIHFFPQAVAGMLTDLEPYLVGEDSERIEYLWQASFRRLFMRGGPVTGAAVSAIDMALWDIKGKMLGVPVYQLLGGAARTKVRLYGHVTGRSATEIAEAARERAGRGITAIRFRGFHTMDDREEFDQQLGVEQQIEYLAAIREAVGDRVDLLLECHGRYDPVWAVELARRAEPYRPFFVEDPIRHENPEALANLRQATGLPLAIGERGHNKWEFRELITRQYVNYVRPDICHCGGISEMIKIITVASAYGIPVIPHANESGRMAAHVLFAQAPNVCPRAEWGVRLNHNAQHFYRDFYEPVDGYYPLPPGPGLGLVLDETKVVERVEL